MYIYINIILKENSRLAALMKNTNSALKNNCKLSDTRI